VAASWATEISGCVNWERTKQTIEFLRGKTGRILGRFEKDTGVTREATGKIIGYGQNQLLKLLK
jgi:hypothetical protein